MTRNILFLFFVLTLFTFMTNIPGIKSLELQEITDSNMNSLVGDGKGQSWLLMFYLETCPYCKLASESIKSISGKNLAKSDELIENLNIGKVECSNNNWSCLRFNVTRVPYIVLLKDDKLFEFNGYASEQKLMEFITSEKTVESGKSIPDTMGMFNIITTILKESVNVFNEQITQIVNDKLNLPIKWKSEYTVAVLIVVLILVIVIEYFIVYFCCSFNKLGNPKPKKQVNKEEDKEDKKEETKKEETKKEEVQNNKEKNE